MKRFSESVVCYFVHCCFKIFIFQTSFNRNTVVLHIVMLHRCSTTHNHVKMSITQSSINYDFDTVCAIRPTLKLLLIDKIYWTGSSLRSFRNEKKCFFFTLSVTSLRRIQVTWQIGQRRLYVFKWSLTKTNIKINA